MALEQGITKILFKEKTKGEKFSLKKINPLFFPSLAFKLIFLFCYLFWLPNNWEEPSPKLKLAPGGFYTIFPRFFCPVIGGFFFSGIWKKTSLLKVLNRRIQIGPPTAEKGKSWPFWPNHFIAKSNPQLISCFGREHVNWKQWNPEKAYHPGNLAVFSLDIYFIPSVGNQ